MGLYGWDAGGKFWRPCSGDPWLLEYALGEPAEYACPSECREVGFARECLSGDGCRRNGGNSDLEPAERPRLGEGGCMEWLAEDGAAAAVVGGEA
jgi:hypothetical protein